MQLLGATQNEILFVAFLVVLVLVAPKVPKMGERVGTWFSRRPGGDKGPSGEGGA